MTGAWALVAVAGLCLIRDTPDSGDHHESLPVAAHAKPAKSSHRSPSLAVRNEHSSAASEAAVRSWMSLLWVYPEKMDKPPLDECRNLSAAAVESFLRDPRYGWPPLLDPAAAAKARREVENSLLGFHRALLARWAEVDFQGALAKIPRPDGNAGDSKMVGELFVQKAKSDPALAIQALQEWSATGVRQDHLHAPMRDVMQAWAAVDPEASWQWIASPASRTVTWSSAVQGYLKGLTAPDWQELLGKAEALPDGAADQLSARNRMRYEVIRAWGVRDPLAALASYDAYSSEPSLSPRSSGQAPEEIHSGNLSMLIGSWMSNEPGTAAKLQAWRPAGQDTDKIYESIGMNGIWPDATRQQAQSLIRDPQTAARVAEARAALRPQFFLPQQMQVCTLAHPEQPQQGR